MTDAIREQISALLDSELSRREMNTTVDHLRKQEEHRDTWDRYNLIGDVIRGEAGSRAHLSVAERVRRQLESEPAILVAPKPNKAPIDWMRPIAGTALAASVAALAIFVAPQILNTGSNVGPQVTTKMLPSFNLTASAPSPALRRLVSTKAHNIQPATGNLIPAALYLRRPGTRWKNLPKPAVASKLNKYLVEHGEYAVQGGMKTVLPYATFVGYDAKR